MTTHTEQPGFLTVEPHEQEQEARRNFNAALDRGMVESDRALDAYPLPDRTPEYKVIYAHGKTYRVVEGTIVCDTRDDAGRPVTIDLELPADEMGALRHLSLARTAVRRQTRAAHARPAVRRSRGTSRARRSCRTRRTASTASGGSDPGSTGGGDDPPPPPHRVVPPSRSSTSAACRCVRRRAALVEHRSCSRPAAAGAVVTAPATPSRREVVA